MIRLEPLGNLLSRFSRDLCDPSLAMLRGLRPGIEAAVAKPAKFRSWKPALDAFSLTVTEARYVRKTIRRARSE